MCIKTGYTCIDICKILNLLSCILKKTDLYFEELKAISQHITTKYVHFMPHKIKLCVCIGGGVKIKVLTKL